jgi:glycosyltransferase involved in cell wall biosynthesis
MSKMTKPSISVILTFYNRPKMVKRAISKILNQTISDFELIIIDDCSKKPLILNKLFLKKKKITYLRNRKNIGANRSRLRGLKLAKGKYICFHDDDDYWLKNKLKKQFNFLEKNPNYYLVSCFAKNKSKIIKFPINFSYISLSILQLRRIFQYSNDKKK